MSARTQQIEQLIESFQAIRRKLASRSAGAFHGALHCVTHSQWGVLRTIADKGHASIKEIAGRLAITSSAATQLVDGLVENGYLQRNESPDDRRSLLIGFSAKAKKQMSLMKKSHIALLSHVFSALSDNELAQYLRLSVKISTSLSHS